MSSPIYYGINSAVVAFLFHAGLWFTGVIINGPNFHTKLTLAAPTIGYRRLMLVDWPSRTLLTVRLARQDAIPAASLMLLMLMLLTLITLKLSTKANN